jgi:hypothetical protein
MTNTTYTIIEGSGRPFWKHDCDACHFAGSFISVTRPEAQAKVHDVYIACGSGSILIRGGDDGPEYQSFPRDILRRFADSGLELREWKPAMLIVAGFYSNVRPTRSAVIDVTEYGWNPAAVRIVRHGGVQLPGQDTGERTWYFIQASEGVEDYEIKRMIHDTFPATRCQHAHDCCGHRYYSAARAWKLPSGTWFVRQDSYINI